MTFVAAAVVRTCGSNVDSPLHPYYDKLTVYKGNEKSQHASEVELTNRNFFRVPHSGEFRVGRPGSTTMKRHRRKHSNHPAKFGLKVQGTIDGHGIHSKSPGRTSTHIDEP